MSIKIKPPQSQNNQTIGDIIIKINSQGKKIGLVCYTLVTGFTYSQTGENVWLSNAPCSQSGDVVTISSQPSSTKYTPYDKKYTIIDNVVYGAINSGPLCFKYSDFIGNDNGNVPITRKIQPFYGYTYPQDITVNLSDGKVTFTYDSNTGDISITNINNLTNDTLIITATCPESSE